MSNHFEIVADALLCGNVTPFLGAGVNLWAEHAPRPPSAAELARLLAPHEPSPDPLDLLSVSQSLELTQGSGPLYLKLREVFKKPYRATPLHELLALLPAHMREAGTASAPLMVTTNYDLVLEQSLCAAGEEFDQIIYVAKGPDKQFARFRHVKWRRGEGGASNIEPGSNQIIEHPNDYPDPDLRAGRHPIILKIHGAVDQSAARNDSYVITEDDYIDYLARADASTLLPAFIGEKLQDCHMLFLGYGLRDWNLRVLLRRIWGGRTHTWNSWAIQKDCKELDRLFWQQHRVELIEMKLETYTETLRERLQLLLGKPAAG